MTVGYNVPAGWEERSGNGKVTSDWETYYSGPASLSIDCTGANDGFCNAWQTIRGFAGLSIVVGGVIKTEGKAKVSLQVEFLDDAQQRFAARRIMFASGTSDWVGGGRQIRLPEGTAYFRITLTVHGAGRAWLDDVSLSAEGVNVRTIIPATPQPWQPIDPALRPVTPTPGWSEASSEWWNDQHNQFLASTAANQGPCDILWFGDSIGLLLGGQSGWEFIPEWRAAFSQYKTLNYSIPGDSTENVLWRMLHGESDGIHPRLIVIEVGTNNVYDRAVPTAAVAAGIRRCAKVARRNHPAAKILVIAPLPIAHDPGAPNRLRLDLIRGQLLNLFRANPDPAVRVLNFSAKFLEADGTISAEILPDFIHPSSLGYARYVECLQPAIYKLLSN
jgi:lysophospholipase L1-like esterase